MCFSDCSSSWKGLFFCCLLFARAAQPNGCQVHSVWRAGGRTWHGDKGTLLSSAAFKLPLPASPEAFWQLSPLHFSGSTAMILGAYISFSWRKETGEVQVEKTLKHFWVLWGQKLWDNADLFMLTLFPEDPSVVSKQPQERRNFYFQFLIKVPPSHAFAIQGREGTNNFKSWEDAGRESFNPKARRFVILTQAREGDCQ